MAPTRDLPKLESACTTIVQARAARVSAYRSIAGLSEIAGDYDLLLCDVFGTLHDARGRFPGPRCARALPPRRGVRWVWSRNAAERARADPHARGPRHRGRLRRAGERRRRGPAPASARAAAGLGPLHRLRTGSPGHPTAFRQGAAGPAADLIVCTGYPEERAIWTQSWARPTAGRAHALHQPGYEAWSPAGACCASRPGGAALPRARRRCDRNRQARFADLRRGPCPAREATGRSFDPARILGLGDTPALDVGGALDAGYAAALLIPAEADPPDGRVPAADTACLP